MEERVTEERIRQIRREEDIMRGETIARTAASGVKVGTGSPLEVLADQQAEFRRERLITEEVGASRAATALESGRALAQQYKYQGIGSAAQGLQNLFQLWPV